MRLISRTEARMPPDLTSHTANAMKRLYDYAYLARHPLLQHLRELVGEEPGIAVQRLRNLLLQATEELRPASDTPADSAAWRPYQVAYRRFVLGKDLEQVQRELGLGRRQLQREQKRAFEAIALHLWTRLSAVAVAPSHEAEALGQEIARAAADRQAFDLGEQIRRAFQSVSALATAKGIRLLYVPAASAPSALGDPTSTRQLLVSALSFLIRLPAISVVRAAVERHGKTVACVLAAESPRVPEADQAPPKTPETVLALAQAAGAELSIEVAGREIRLTADLHAAGGERVIAIVEDNADLAALFSRYLAHRGYHVALLNNPEHALEHIRQMRPDAVILDVMMNSVDGWEVLQGMRAHPLLRSTPVAVCSVLDEQELALSLGADAYLRKPVRPALLLECLSQMLAPERRKPAVSAP